MLLTKNSAALGLLLDNHVLDHGRTQVLFGSDFPLDKTDLQVCLNIQKVKYCMQSGTTLVLVHCEALYESMYDLLNQHYTKVTFLILRPSTTWFPALHDVLNGEFPHSSGAAQR